MGRGMPAHIVRRQGLAGFVGMHRHMFGAVVGIDAADVFHCRDAGDIAYQYRQPDDALNEVADDGRGQERVNQAHRQQRQDEKDADAEQQRDGDGQGHCPVADFRLRGRGRATSVAGGNGMDGGAGVGGVGGVGGRCHRFLGGDNGGALQRFHSQPEGFSQYQHAAQEGDAAGPAGEAAADGFGGAENGAVGAAHGQAVMPRAADHYAFDHGLPAVEGTVGPRRGNGRGGWRPAAGHAGVAPVAVVGVSLCHASLKSSAVKTAGCSQSAPSYSSSSRPGARTSSGDRI